MFKFVNANGEEIEVKATPRSSYLTFMDATPAVSRKTGNTIAGRIDLQMATQSGCSFTLRVEESWADAQFQSCPPEVGKTYRVVKETDQYMVSTIISWEEVVES